MLFAVFLVVVSTIFAFVSVFAVRTGWAVLDCAVFAAGFCLVELVLDHSLGMELSVAASRVQHSSTYRWRPMRQWAASGSFRCSARSRRRRCVTLWRRRLVPFAVATAVWIVGWAIPAGLWTTEGETVRVALVQGNVRLAEKWADGSADSILARYRAMTRLIGAADLVVWPETALPTTLDVVGRRLAESVDEKGIPLIAGVFDRSGRLGQTELYNAMVGIDGDSQSIYRKRQLVPFAEYTPLEVVVRERARSDRLSDVILVRSERAWFAGSGGPAAGGGDLLRDRLSAAREPRRRPTPTSS